MQIAHRSLIYRRTPWLIVQGTRHRSHHRLPRVRVADPDNPEPADTPQSVTDDLQASSSPADFEQQNLELITTNNTEPAVNDASWSDETKGSEMGIDWEAEDASPPGPRQTTNVLFGLLLGGVAALSWFLMRQHAQYRQTRPPPDTIATTAIASSMQNDPENAESSAQSQITDQDVDQQEVEGNEDIVHAHSSHVVLPPAAKESISRESSVHSTHSKDQSARKNNNHHHVEEQNEVDVVPAVEATAHAAAAELSDVGQASESSRVNGIDPPTAGAAPTYSGNSKIKYPIRTPEGAAALAKIRALQERRKHLYDRLDEKQEQHYIEAFEEPRAAAVETEEAANAGEHSDFYDEGPYVFVPSGGEVGEKKKHAKVVIPKGMSLKALKERAHAASKAAASATAAASKAASASAMAAEAADVATHAARQASEAAEQCQEALDTRSTEAMERAYKAAVEAENVTSEATRKAAVAAAKATQHEHDAKQHIKVAESAADMSAPRSIPEKLNAAWVKVHRGAKNVGETVQHGGAVVVDTGKNLVDETVHEAHVLGERVNEAWVSLKNRLTRPKS